MRRVCFCLCCFGVTDAKYGHMRTPTAESWNHPKITIRPWAVFSMVKRLDYKRKYVDKKRTSHAFSYSSQASTDDWLIIGCLVCVWDGFVWASFRHFGAFRCSVSIHVGRCAGLGVGGWASGVELSELCSFLSFLLFGCGSFLSFLVFGCVGAVISVMCGVVSVFWDSMGIRLWCCRFGCCASGFGGFSSEPRASFQESIY